MNDFDRGLEDALRDLADVAPTGDDVLWDATQRRIVHRRRRRTAMSAAGSGLTVVAIIVGVVAIASERDNVEVGDVGTTTSTVASTPSTVTPPIRAEDHVVARADGTIEVVDSDWVSRGRDGLIVSLPGQYIRQIAVAPDGDRVYYLVDHDPGAYGSDCADLYVVGVETAPTLIAQTRSFALSPNGERLVLGMYQDADRKCVAPEVEANPTMDIYDAKTGELEERYLATEPPVGQFESMRWNAAPQLLTSKVCSADACYLVTFDTEDGAVIPALSPDVLLDDQIVAVAWSNGTLHTLEHAEEGDSTLVLRTRDPELGGVTNEVPILESWAGDVDLVDVGGELHLLAVDGTAGGVEARLYRLEGGEPVPVAEGFTAVAP